MPRPPSRRFNRRTFLAFAAGATALVAFDSFGVEPRRLDVTEHAVPVRLMCRPELPLFTLRRA